MIAFARAVSVEARKLLSSRALPALAACAALLAALTMTSPAEFPGGPLLMAAGSDPSRIGGAIGFIGNVVDPSAPGLSAVRTSLVYTVLWIPVAIAFGLATFSVDFSCGAASVSRARGASLAESGAARILVACCAMAVLYAASCVAALVFKAAQHGAAIGPSELSAFAGAGAVNALGLCALASWSAALYAMSRGSFITVVAQLALAALVLLGYPSAYGAAASAGAVAPVLPWALHPVFYLLNAAALCLDTAQTALALGVCAAMLVGGVAAAAVASHLKEV